MPSLKRRLGVHTSIAEGIHLSVERAWELRCNTVQIFSHNPRTWLIKEMPHESVLRFKGLRRAYDITPVFIHTSYLINLASSNIDVLNKSLNLLIQELDIADALGADYLVLHTGSASQDTAEISRKRAINALKEISAKKTWRAGLLLENTAGERGDISSNIKDLAEIIRKTDSSLIAGVCIDTCHAFQAGYDLSDPKFISEIAAEIGRYIGFEGVKLIHLNDSKKDLGNRVDRHDHIGSGKIGIEGLRNFINHPEFKNIPLILETPKKEPGDDARNLAVARSLFH